MGNYDFKTDLAIANKTEGEVAKVLETRGNTILSYNSDYRYDIEIETTTGKTFIEVKEDFMAFATGNICIEFEGWGKKSGIVKTEADYYVYKLFGENGQVDEFYTASVDKIKNSIISCEYERIVIGGDEGSNTKMYLITLENFKKIATKIK